ncbi:MAG: hydrogenase small subunit [Peptococcaceae bacterium]|nr:hydrogenase small subunit [Peptococcaceae bacterium]
MRSISRREFIKLCAGSAAGLSLMSALGPQITESLAWAAEGKPTVVWLQGAACTGCSVSLLNSVEPAIEKVLLDVISLRYHPNIMASAGHVAFEQLEEIVNKEKDNFFLVVEGGVPTGAEGHYCTIGELKGKEITFAEAVATLGNAAKAVIAAGSCASFGGIPGATPNPTSVVGVDQIVTKKPVINIGNCPMHPDHFLGTVVYVLQYGDIPELDRFKRPKMFYPEPIHETCPRRPYFDAGQFAETVGDEGCLAHLGCKGFIAYSDCQKRKWNNGRNWCIGAGAPCLGCSEPYFPDDCSPFYGLWPLKGMEG